MASECRRPIFVPIKLRERFTNKTNVSIRTINRAWSIGWRSTSFFSKKKKLKKTRYVQIKRYSNYKINTYTRTQIQTHFHMEIGSEVHSRFKTEILIFPSTGCSLYKFMIARLSCGRSKRIWRSDFEHFSMENGIGHVCKMHQCDSKQSGSFYLRSFKFSTFERIGNCNGNSEQQENTTQLVGQPS